jgi:hypothetical protein
MPSLPLYYILSTRKWVETRKSSNKTMLCLTPRNKLFLTSPMTSRFHILFYYTFYLSLQASEKQDSSVGIVAGCSLDGRCSIRTA